MNMKINLGTDWFDERKAAQIAAFFIQKAGGNINVLKLVKLIYLADRKCMEEYDFPMTYDHLVSMDHGPVNSIIYNCINGMREDQKEWDAIIADRAAHNVGLTGGAHEVSFDRLSKAELRVLENAWAAFGKMGEWEIRDWTHENCPEWDNPHGSSKPISYKYVFTFLKKKNAHELAENVERDRGLLASLAAT
jgi:uncharacterized phage-associated protein